MRDVQINWLIDICACAQILIGWSVYFVWSCQNVFSRTSNCFQRNGVTTSNPTYNDTLTLTVPDNSKPYKNGVWQGCDDVITNNYNSQWSAELAMACRRGMSPSVTVLVCKGSRDRNPSLAECLSLSISISPLPNNHLCSGRPPGS